MKGANEGTGADVDEEHKCQEPGLECTHPAGKEAAAETLMLNNEAPDGVCAT